MESVCVFCGSSKGKNPAFVSAAKELGELLAKEEIRLIYGGGKIGLMGEIANACMANGGEVIGVIPAFLAKKEIAHREVTQLITVESMHDRKLKMAQLADGFIALPGGYGTLEELCEILTWVQLALVNKPVGILNVEGFYDKLFEQFDHMVAEELLKASNLDFCVRSEEAASLLKKMKTLSIDNQHIADKFIHT